MEACETLVFATTDGKGVHGREKDLRSCTGGQTRGKDTAG